MSAIVLHDYWRSSASYRVRVALNVVGLEYEAAPVDILKGELRLRLRAEMDRLIAEHLRK